MLSSRSRRDGVWGNKSPLFFVGDMDVNEGNGIAKSRAFFFVGERDGDDGGAGNLREDTAEGEQDAKVRVSADTLGA